MLLSEAKELLEKNDYRISKSFNKDDRYMDEITEIVNDYNSGNCTSTEAVNGILNILSSEY